jgi:dolichol-phosphate mannosyltransferase
MPPRKGISVVVPCYNEQEVLPETHARLTEVLSGLDEDYELIYVNDGSTDETGPILADLARKDANVRALFFSRNFGHSAAVTAGIDHAEAEGVVLIDADLQDPPEVIEEMVRRWRAGADVVYGVRSMREGESLFKRGTAWLFYWLINRLASFDLPRNAGDFRLMDRKVVEALRMMGEQDRYIRGMVTWVGFRQEPVAFQRRKRQAGRTKYPLRKMIRFGADAVLSFSVKPLRVATWTGVLASIVAFAGLVYALAVRLFTGDWQAGWASLAVAVFFLGGVQLICLGILGEYIGRIYREAKARPLYLIARKLGGSHSETKQAGGDDG